MAVEFLRYRQLQLFAMSQLNLLSSIMDVAVPEAESVDVVGSDIIGSVFKGLSV